MTYAVIMVRSRIDIKPAAGHTLKLLRLNKINHCVLLPEDEFHKGMVIKVKDYVTWGEVDGETVRKLIKGRGRLLGDGEVTDAHVKANSPYSSVDELTKALVKGEAKMKDVKGLKPLFRLSPPRKGWKGIKRTYNMGGALGYRGGNINDLIGRMI
jgi:large subunit ribosomal protein L30